jgi:poly-beta-hydroxyalkanoate depolymerase
VEAEKALLHLDTQQEVISNRANFVQPSCDLLDGSRCADRNAIVSPQVVAVAPLSSWSVALMW